MALYRKADGSTVDLQDYGGENAGNYFNTQDSGDLTDYGYLMRQGQLTNADPPSAKSLYNPDDYQFRADGTVQGPNGTEQMVIVPDHDGSLNALNGLGGQGYAIVPKSVADQNGLQITGVRGADPNYDEGGLSGILMKYGPAIIAGGAGLGAAGLLGGTGELVGGASGALGGATSSGFAGGAGIGAAEAAGAAGAGLGLVGGASSQAVPTGIEALAGGAGGGAEGGIGAELAGAGAGIGQSAGEIAAGVGSGAAGTAATAGSALSRIIDGTATTADYLSVLGTAGATGLGLYASNQQSNALQDLANKYLDLGAPSRARYEASMSPGFDPTTIPGYSGALDTASQSILRKLSATGGNPYGNPGALIEANKSIVNGTALPAVQEYQRLNAGTGGIANLTAAAPAASSAAVGSNTNFYNAIGSGISSLTNPQTSLADLFKRYGGLSAT